MISAEHDRDQIRGRRYRRRIYFQSVCLGTVVVLLLPTLMASVAAATDSATAEPCSPGRTIRVRADQPGPPLHRFWHVANFALQGRYTFTRPEDYQTLMGRAPFTRDVLVDFLLGGRFPDGPEWLLGADADGTVRTDFTGMIARVQAVLDAGLTPWLMLEKVPPGLSDPPRWHAYGNTAPAADNRAWYAYVRQAVQALVEAFGRETVAGWRIMVATEPDLRPAHWAGTRDEFFAHLDCTVAAVHSVLPEAKVSPGNILNPQFAHERPDRETAESASLVRARDQWGLEIIDHAATGANACTGGRGTPMAFFSASWYVRVGRPADGFDRAIQVMRTRLDRYPQFEGIPVDIREFGVLHDASGRRLFAGDMSEWSASFYASVARRVYAHNVRVVFEWDYATSGVLHPRGQVMAMLERMVDGRRLPVAAAGDPAVDCHAIAVVKDDELLVLLYNHRPERQAAATETVRLEIVHPAMEQGRPWRLSEWTIDKDHTVWAHAFHDDAVAAGLERLGRAGEFEGSPRRCYGEQGVEVFQRNIDRYRDLAQLPRTRHDVELTVGSKRAQLDITMPAHSVRLLELTPRSRRPDVNGASR